MTERIHTVRSAFASPGHVVDAVGFARGMLRSSRAAVARQVAEAGFAPAGAIGCLDVEELADPDEGTLAEDRPVSAYVNAGRWLAKCECGGCEYVDLEQLVFMCCNCWNAEVGHRWRPIVIPKQRVAIERLLLKRPDGATRNWRPGETIADLARENREHGVEA